MSKHAKRPSFDDLRQRIHAARVEVDAGGFLVKQSFPESPAIDDVKAAIAALDKAHGRIDADFVLRRDACGAAQVSASSPTLLDDLLAAVGSMGLIEVTPRVWRSPACPC